MEVEVQEDGGEVGGAGDQKVWLSSEPVGSQQMQLQEVFTVEQFQQLLHSLHYHGQQQRRRRRGGRGGRTGGIPTAEFQLMLAHILNVHPESGEIAALCNKLDPEGRGCVQEEEFCSHVLQQLQEKDSLLLGPALPFQELPCFRRCLHSKETLLRLLSAANPQRCLSVSKDGTVSTWSSSLQLQRGNKLQGDPLQQQVGGATRSGGGRRGTLRVTDAAVMSDCGRLVVSTTSCELAFYDTTNYHCKYRLQDLPCVPLCLDYHSSSKASPSSRLLYGDISGSVAVFTFHRPVSALFLSPSKEEETTTTTLIPFPRIAEHCQFVSLQLLPQVHGDWVRRVAYIPHNHSFISCSACPAHSLVFRDVLKKNKSYVFRIRKGVVCFDYCHQLDVLVTGSLDHVVRVWNPHVPSRPMARLTAHAAVVLDVLVDRHRPGLLFSFSQDSVLCAWDMFEHSLIQSISVKFPFIQRLPDYGPGVLSLLPPSHPHTLTVLCNEYIAELKLGEVGGANQKWSVVSHNHPLCSALYNEHFEQVVSGCEGGEVKVWSVESGRLVLRLSHTHDASELTALSLDATGRRLLTGSRQGDIKVWGYREGVCLKHMSGFSSTEVTGVKHLRDKSRFLAVGWNRRITTFPDDPDSYDVKSDVGWQGDDHHSDDILCVAYSPPYYLATGSFDGSIKIWNLDTEKMVSQFRSMTKLKTTLIKGIRKASLEASRTTPLRSFSSLRSSSGVGSRPASRRLSTYRARANSVHQQHVPVDAVLFLQARMTGAARLKGTAVLVTSEAGHAHFWDIFGSSEPMGSFPLTELEEEHVLALQTDPLNSLLLAGDTAGFVSLFPLPPHYCCTSSGSPPTPAREHCSTTHTTRWRAHAGEILSVEYVSHEGAGPLVLTSSGDQTVRLWTLAGHYVGTFGQEQPWNLQNPSSFQHPRTPWGDVKSPFVLSAFGSRAATPAPKSPVIPVLREEFEGDDEMEATSKPVKQAQTDKLLRFSDSLDFSSPNNDSTISAKALGAPYKEGIKRRMMDRHERRSHFADIDSTLTERFGSLCSPYQALHMPTVNDVTIPQQLRSVVDLDTP